MENKIIITIGRQFGSGGKQIGQALANRLGIAFYDKELINLASQESGLCPEVFEKADERTSGSLLQAFAMGISMNHAIYQPNNYLSNESLFRIQSDVIHKLAHEKSCILVGRCADYILRENKNCINLFIQCPLEERIQRISQSHQLSEQEAAELIHKTDKARAGYYNYYTDKTWGAAASYDLTVNSSVLGIEETTAFLQTFAERLFHN